MSARVSLSRPTYVVTSSHTFATPDLTDRIWLTPEDAWAAASVDYAVTDAGLDRSQQVRDALRIAHRFEAGSLTLSTGETITVREILPADACHRDDLHARVEFDCPFRVWPGHVVTDAPADVYVPDVMDDHIQGDGWQFVTTGYTQQYGYRGPTMHASEYLGGALADDILSTPGVYVLTTSHASPDDDEDDDDTLAGWVVLRQS